MKLQIKNMVSISCIMIVKSELDKLGLQYTNVRLGEVEVKEDQLPSDKYEKLKVALNESGLQLLEDKKSMLIEKIKNAIIEMIHYSDIPPKTKLSDYLSEKLEYDYTYLSNLFTKVMGATIKHFIIAHRIERVKELLKYEELTLSEIAWKMNYSSVAHLSSQFKQMTGVTARNFKKSKNKKLIALEKL